MRLFRYSHHHWDAAFLLALACVTGLPSSEAQPDNPLSAWLNVCVAGLQRQGRFDVYEGDAPQLSPPVNGAQYMDKAPGEPSHLRYARFTIPDVAEAHSSHVLSHSCKALEPCFANLPACKRPVCPVCQPLGRQTHHTAVPVRHYRTLLLSQGIFSEHLLAQVGLPCKGQYCRSFA